MAALLEQIGYSDVMVGWSHLHPGFDVWFSDVDASNQGAREHQDEWAVGIVVHPVLRVRGKVVIRAFRNVPGCKEKRFKAGKVRREDPREKTSFVGETVQLSETTRHQGLNLR
jgi:hypothetical protein